MDWLLSIFGCSPTTTRTAPLDTRVQNQAFENAVAATMTSNKHKHPHILPHQSNCIDRRRCQGSCSKCTSEEGDIPDPPPLLIRGTPPPVFNPSERSPPNSPARPIGPGEEWYIGEASGGGGCGGCGGGGGGVANGQEQEQHPHPLRSNPTHALVHDGEGERSQNDGGENGGGGSGVDAEGEASGSVAGGEVGSKSHPHAQRTRADVGREVATKLEKMNDAEAIYGAWIRDASGLGPGEAWYA